MYSRLLTSLILCSGYVSAQTTIDVPAMADPWRAGGYVIPNSDGEGDVPPEIRFVAGPGHILTISASGLWSSCGDPLIGPEGGGQCGSYTTVDIEPTGGMSGIQTKEATLAGVFLSLANPPRVTQENGIGTVFVVGLGGAFPVPPTATRMILGMPDENVPANVLGPPGAYSDNTGQVSATYKLWNAASLIVNPGSGAPGSVITLSGSGFGPNRRVDIYAGAIAGPPSYTASADSTGAFALAAAEVQRPYGALTLFAVDTVGDLLGVSNFSVTPILNTIPRTGVPGATAIVLAAGFGAAETVDIFWNSPRQLLATVTTSALGSATGPFTIPADATRGLNGLLGIGQTTNATGLGAFIVQ